MTWVGFGAKRKQVRYLRRSAAETVHIIIGRLNVPQWSMASRPSLRESLGLPTRVDAPVHIQKKKSVLPAGGRTSGVGPANRRKTQVLAKGSRPSSAAVGPARSGDLTKSDHNITLHLHSHKRSSVYGHGGHSQPKKDPRPLSDKCRSSHNLSSLTLALSLSLHSLPALLHKETHCSEVY